MGNKFAPDFAHFDPLSVARQDLGPVARTYGRKRVISGNFEVATGDLDAADVIILCPVRSSAVLHSFKISNDDLDGGATGTVDIGICDKDGVDINTGAGDSLDLFAQDAITFRAAVAPSAATELAFDTAAQDVQTAPGAQMWERVNLQTASVFTEDPNRQWFLCMRQVLAGTAQAGTIGYQVEITLD